MIQNLPIRKVYVQNSVRDTDITRHVLERVGDLEIEYIDDARPVIEAHKMSDGADLSRGKQALLLSDFRGEPIKPCPGTMGYLCCGYQILNFGQGCPIDCTYCILQGYFSNPLMIVQANSEAFLAAAADRLRSEPDRFFRLGTGEFADSLALDHLTGYARRLVEFIRDIPNAILELKSKADLVDDILDADHGGKTVCAWSVNSAEISKSEELRAASLDERFAAATRCRDAGYRLAFHFDPIFYYDGWEEGYRRTIHRIFETASAKDICWISLGCFRYMPGMEQIVRKRFPKTQFTFAEFILADDRKMRYPQPLRIHIYEKMMKWIREAGGEDVLVYFCMENPSVWQTVMGRCPRDNDELAGWLDQTVKK